MNTVNLASIQVLETNEAKPFGRSLGRALSRGVSRLGSRFRGLGSRRSLGSSFNPVKESRGKRILKGLGKGGLGILGTTLLGVGIDQYLGSRGTDQDYTNY